MNPKPAIAHFWTRADGARCLLYKDDAGWWLTVERDGVPLKRLAVPGPAEAIRTAAKWRDEPGAA